MSNMSYCRFENTARDLGDCWNALEEIADGDEGPLSRDELEGAESVCRLSWKILVILAEHADLDLANLWDTRDPINAINEAVHRLQNRAIALREEQGV